MSKEVKKNMKPPKSKDINEMELFRHVLKTGRETIEELNTEYSNIIPEIDLLNLDLYYDVFQDDTEITPSDTNPYKSLSRTKAKRSH